MAKKKVVKKKVVRHEKKSYSLIEGNSNELLLVVGAVCFVIFSVIYLSR